MAPFASVKEVRLFSDVFWAMNVPDVSEILKLEPNPVEELCVNVPDVFRVKLAPFVMFNPVPVWLKLDDPVRENVVTVADRSPECVNVPEPDLVRLVTVAMVPAFVTSISANSKVAPGSNVPPELIVRDGREAPPPVNVPPEASVSVSVLPPGMM